MPKHTNQVIVLSSQSENSQGQLQQISTVQKLDEKKSDKTGRQQQDGNYGNCGNCGNCGNDSTQNQTHSHQQAIQELRSELKTLQNKATFNINVNNNGKISLQVKRKIVQNSKQQISQKMEIQNQQNKIHLNKICYNPRFGQYMHINPQKLIQHYKRLENKSLAYVLQIRKVQKQKVQNRKKQILLQIETHQKVIQDLNKKRLNGSNNKLNGFGHQKQNKVNGSQDYAVLLEQFLKMKEFIKNSEHLRNNQEAKRLLEKGIQLKNATQAQLNYQKQKQQQQLLLNSYKNNNNNVQAVNEGQNFERNVQNVHQVLQEEISEDQGEQQSEQLQQQLQKNQQTKPMIYWFNNDPKLQEQYMSDPYNKWRYLMWSEQEDQVLYMLTRNEQISLEFKALRKQKTPEYILDRVKFLKIQLPSEIEKDLRKRSVR